MTNEQIAKSLATQLYTKYLTKDFNFTVNLRFMGNLEAMVVEVMKGRNFNYEHEDALFMVDPKTKGENIVESCMEILEDYVDTNEREGNL